MDVDSYDKTQNAIEVNGVKKPFTNITHQKKFIPKTEQIENNNKNHENVINKKQLEELTVRIYIVIFRVFICVLLSHLSAQSLKRL
jgi:hypothetical protein